MEDNKSKKNWRKIALTSLTVALALSAAGGLAFCGKKPETQDVPGLGFFYYDTEAGENQLALGANYKATFSVDGVIKEATYEVQGDVVTLTFADSSKATAKMSSDSLILSYDNNDYKFFKKVYYTVSYEELGGSDVVDATVVNGQTFAKPADPKKPGYEFLGWYTDSEYKNPYSFSQIVTGNVTLYAQWASVDPAVMDYTVDFDLGYDAQNPQEMTTKSGKLYNVPTPTRDGYKFCGWWISMYEDGQKLTYKYTPDTVFTANTTMFAVWETDNLGSKLSAPEVEVNETGVYWNGLNGVSRYALKIDGPRGFSTVEEDVSGTSYTDVNFANAPEGDYVITVTALAQSGAANNSATVTRYYKNKAVGRVSQFTVLDGNRLLFNRVENAETYYITVDCGDDAHTHIEYNIGESTYFDFSSCEMQEGGIKFTVTAAANGYASTTSETFVYNRVLNKVEGVSVDEESQMLSWYSVKNATNYVVKVTCGNTTETVNVGSKTSYSLKGYPMGEVKVSVSAQTDGYNSAEATEFVYNKTKLATPVDLKLVSTASSYKLTWKKVAGATSYSVKLGTTIYTVQDGADFQGSDYVWVDVTQFAWVDEATYGVEVKAMADGNESVWSDSIEVRYGVMNPSLKYKSGVVTWQPTVGAVGYQVRVESSAIESYGADVMSAPVSFEKDGTNVIYVRCVIGHSDGSPDTYSQWVGVSVENVQTIQYYDEGRLVETAYKVIGDKVNAPTPQKAGYNFAGWYTTSRGPANNGTKYDDEYFVGTSELTLYAYWTPATYELVYDVGAGGAMNETSAMVTYTKGYKLDVPTVEDGSKVFLGWFAGPAAGAQQLTDDRGYSLKNWSLKEGITVYAQYVTDVLEFTLLEDGTYSVSKGRNVHKVTTITIPEKYNNIDVTVVDGYAFEGRSNIVRITMPDTIKIVERETAFYLCNGLQEINVYHVDGNNTPIYSSVDGVLLKKDEITGQTQLCYYPLSKGGTYEIPEGVTEIPLNLFKQSKVKEVVVPTSVAIIREDAFRDCAFLETVTFAEGGTDTLTIEDGAFSNCTSLVEITLPNRLAELQLDEETRTLTLFDGCNNLQYVNVEKGSSFYSSIDGVLTNATKNKLLYCPAARTGSYTIPRGVIEVGERAFYNCTKLTEIVIPGYVESIGEYAFYGCNKASRVVFDKGAITGMELIVGDYAFAEMSNLKAVVFDDSSVVTTLGNYAFANATSLREFKVPASMTYIGDYAFDTASALNKVTFAENGADLTFGNYVFNDCKALTRVELPSTVVKLNLGVFDGCVNISEVKVHQNNENYKDDDGIVFSKDGTELVFFPKGRQPDANGEYVIPEGVESISDGAFKGMRYIEKIVIKNTITHIGKNAFANSMQLATLEFQAGNDSALLTIDESAFEGCSRIQSIVLPTRTEVIGAKAFYKVSIKSITFPSGVTTIGDYAFSGSALETVMIPAGLQKLGTNVFEACVNLKTVEFETGFNATEIPVGTFKASGLTTIAIPASIEKIGYTAFNDCADLVNVTFDAGTADLVIGYAPEDMDMSGAMGVFMKASKLATITIPDRAVFIGRYAFANCSALATVNVSENSRLQRIGDSAFTSCTRLKSFYVPKTVENTAYVNEQTAQEYAIGKAAFNNSGLTTITFGMGGTGDLSIGADAFSGTAITQLNLPNRLAPIWTLDYQVMVKVEGISKSCFTFGSGASISAINIEAGGNYYGSQDGVLYRVKNGVLDELMYVPVKKTGGITIPATVTLLADNCAEYSTISTITWEDADNANGLPLSIGKYALRYMPNLKDVRFPERTVAIGDEMFYGSNSKVQTVYIPANVETIGKAMFNGCTSVTTVTFADGCKITKIPDSMFYNASNLTAIRVPANVETIGQYAFRGCSKVTTFGFEDGSKLKKLSGAIFQGMKLTELTIPDSVTDLDGNVFNSMTSLQVLNLPAGFTNISTMGNQQQSNFLFDGCTALTAVNIDQNNPYFKSVDGVVFTKDGKTLIYFPRAKKIGNLVQGSTTNYDGVYVTPAGCQTIGTYAFKSNTNLKDLTISADLLYVNWQAFNACTNLAKLRFAERQSTLSLGDYAFQSCSKLGNNGADTLTIPETVEIAGDSTFSGTRYGYVVFEEGNTTTSLIRTFYNCSYLKEVTGIPEYLTSMDQTFYGCSRLTKAEFAEGAYVNSMFATFRNCSALVNIHIPSIGSMTVKPGNEVGVFQGCTKLESVTIDECGFIGVKAFYGCTKLKSFVMPDSVSNMGYEAFYNCTGLESVKLSSGLETIPQGAFYNCSKLTSVVIGGFVTNIESNAFKGCSSLTSVTLPDGLITIGNSAFEGASRVRELVLPDSLESIGEKAFMGWSALEKVAIPVKVKSIGAYAFSGCSNVSELVIPEGAMLESIGDYAFQNMSKLTEFFIPANLTDLGIGIFAGWSKLESVTVDGSNGEFAYDGGILYNSIYTKMILVTPNVPETLVIRETITELSEGIFAGLSFKRVELPDVITEIPAQTFRGCRNLESIKMPKYLEKIGEAAFEGCVSLTSIDIPNSVHSSFVKEGWGDMGKDGVTFWTFGWYTTEDVDGIGPFAFANCTSLASVNFVEGGAQRLSIGDYAFYGCTSLTSISIPNRVRGDAVSATAWNINGSGEMHSYGCQGIGAYAFARCTNLESVVFEETGIATFSEKLIIEIGAFTDCTKLQSVQFNSALGDMYVETVERDITTHGASAIQARAFAGCTALTEVKFAENYDFTKMTVVTSAFADCRVELPKGVVFIDGSFYSGLDSGRPNVNTSIDQYNQLGGCSHCGKFWDASKYGITK